MTAGLLYRAELQALDALSISQGRVVRAELTTLGATVETFGRVYRAALAGALHLPAPAVSIGTATVEGLTRRVGLSATAVGYPVTQWEWATEAAVTLTSTGSSAAMSHGARLTATTVPVTVRYLTGGEWSPTTTVNVPLTVHRTWMRQAGQVIPTLLTEGAPATVDRDELTTPEDTPTFAYAALGASAAPTVPGGVWLREKRAGAAETAPGGTQSVTGALDMDGSTRFRYPGTPAAMAWATNAGQYVETDFIPGGGTPQNAKWLFNLEFVLEGTDEVELRLNAPSANPRVGVVLVNGRRVSDKSIVATASAGAGYSVRMKFPSIGRRTIKIIGLNGNQGRFGGVAVPPGGSVTKPTSPLARVWAVIGDSFTYGAAGVPAPETLVWDLGRKIGADAIVLAGIGGTGFVTPNGTQPNSMFIDRVAAVLATNPYGLMVVGGCNDGNKAGLGAAVDAFFDATTSIPNRWMISQDRDVAGNLVIKASATAKGVPFVDMSDYMSKVPIADGTHPTFEGHRQFADLAYSRMQVTPPGSASIFGRVYWAGLGNVPPAPADPNELTPATGVPSPGLFFELPTAQQVIYPDRKVLAHYFAPYPITLDNQTPASDYYARNYLAVNGESGAHAAYGGLLRDRPRTAAPYPTTAPGYLRAYMGEEIRNAKQAGIDGFFMNIMGSSGQNWDRYVALSDEASANHPGFLCVPMIDANGGISSESTATVAARINTMLSKSCRWRLDDGRYVVASFKAEGKALAWWQEVLGLVKTTHGKDTAFIGVYNNINQAVNYAAVQYGSGQWGPGADPQIINLMTDYGKTIKGRGEKFLYPVWAQDVRYKGQNFDEARNTEALRASWARAINTNADIVQLCTWSDYSEASQFNPSAARGFVTQDLSAWYIAQWKTGKKPRVLRDVMYVSHRNQMLNATITGGQTSLNTHWVRGNRSALRESVEILTFLTEPATVTVKIGSSTYTYSAVAGMQAQLYPMAPGEVSVKAVRSGAEVARVNSPYVIKSTTVNMDRAYFMAGSIRGTSGQYDPTPGSPAPNPANFLP